MEKREKMKNPEETEKQEKTLDDREYKSIMEGILYLWGDPFPTDDFVSVLGIPKRKVRSLLEELAAEKEHYRSGLVLKSYGDSWQLVTRKSHAPYFQKLIPVSKKRPLSNSAMEILAIIAYKQPITRIEIDDLRGVRSTSSIDTLMERGLIEEAGRLDRIGRPILYKTTEEFLRFFDLETLEELPKVEGLELLDTKVDSEDSDETEDPDETK